MSDTRYAPYGVDDDPFLTHPAGAGRMPAAQPAYSRGYWDGDAAPQPHPTSGHGAAPHGYQPARFRQPDHTAPNHPAQDYAAPNYPAPDYPAHHYPASHYDTQPLGQPAYGRGVDGAPYPQQGNFTRRPNAAPQGYLDARMGGDPYAPRQEVHAPQPAPYRAPSFAAERPYKPDQPRPQAVQPPDLHRAAPPAHLRAPVAYAQPQDRRAEFEPDTNAPMAIDKAGLMQWAGALCTVAALIGAALWGYELALRDANGIPVVRASIDPLRIAPETPGGEISAHQGLAVNAIPAAGSAPAAPEQIFLAPQTAALSPEDLGAPIVESGSFAGGASAVALEGASDMTGIVPQAAGGLGADIAALPGSLPDDMPMTDAEAVERALEAALAEGGALQGGSAGTDIAQIDPVSMSQTDPSAPPTSELDPSAIAIGTPMVQLGAFDSDATARSEWANLQTRFTELMAGKALVIEPAKSGGRDFFRLRAHGFETADDTRRFCAAVLAENGSCFPVDQR